MPPLYLHTFNHFVILRAVDSRHTHLKNSDISVSEAFLVAVKWHERHSASVMDMESKSFWPPSLTEPSEARTRYKCRRVVSLAGDEE